MGLPAGTGGLKIQGSISRVPDISPRDVRLGRGGPRGRFACYAGRLGQYSPAPPPPPGRHRCREFDSVFDSDPGLPVTAPV